MVTKTGRATARMENFKALSFQTNVQKITHLPKTWNLTGKQFEDVRRKKTKTFLKKTNGVLDFLGKN